jgi:hypothetical protein
MSLDVYLTVESKIKKTPTSGIFIRENGETKEISREEWDKRYPGREPVKVVNNEEGTNEVYSANITHNLNTMADKAGIYEALWRPEEINITKAAFLIVPLRMGLERLKANPDEFKKYNPKNGWGTYEGLVQFVEKYLEACRNYPNAKIEVSR